MLSSATVVVTLGARGCIARHHGQVYEQAAFAVDVVDSTGAGDTFCGALLAAWSAGADMAAALRREFLAECLIGCGPQAEQARALGLVDQVIEDPATAVRGADLVVLAAPPSVLPDLLRQIAPALDQFAVVTDVASTKQGVIAAAREHLA